MTDSKIRLGTFRIPENTWKDFVAKARSNGDNASSILLNTVHAYLNSAVNSAASTSSPAIAISSTATNPSSNTPTPAIAISSSLPLPIPTNSTVSILLAIAPDNQILYIDRGMPQHWNPPYHLRNANPNADYRLEFLTASDSSILPPIEDILVKTFKPPFNFKTKTNLDRLDRHIDKELQPAAAVSIPLHLSDRIHSLLTNGLSPEDIHRALNTLHLHSQKSETDHNSNPHSDQINLAIASITKITDRISTIEENLIQLQLTNTNSQKPTTTTTQTQANTDTTSPNQTKPKPLPLKGTASVKQLPSPLGTTELAQRLNISVKRLEKVRSQYKDSTQGFFKYTLNKENGKFGWIYDPTQRLHIPYLEIPIAITPINAATATPKEMQTLPNPSDIKEKSESTPPKLNPDKSTKKPKPKPLPNLNQSQLARRFGVNPSTLSRKRATFQNGYISTQDFDSWCQSKDPDNLLWTFSEDSQNYTCHP